MKLSPRQVEVIRLMADGWEMGIATTMDGDVRLQKGGLGMGGEGKSVNLNTFNALSLKELITQKRRGFPESLWGLTALGRQEAELRKVEP